MDKKLIYSGNSQVLVSGIKNILEEAGIAYFEVNKSDSSYPGIIGQIEVLVLEKDEGKAKLLVKNMIN